MIYKMDIREDPIESFPNLKCVSISLVILFFIALIDVVIEHWTSVG